MIPSSGKCILDTFLNQKIILTRFETTRNKFVNKRTPIDVFN